MVKDTVQTCKKYLAKACGEETEEKRAIIYTRLILCGKLRAAVHWITDRGQCGVYQTGDTCKKT